MTADRPPTSGDLNRRYFLRAAGLTGAATVLTAGLSPLAAAQAPRQPSDLPNGTSKRKVLFIDIDGVRRDAISAVGTPVLTALALQGQLSHTRTHKPPPKTVSGPGHSNIVTGVWPRKHGVTTNRIAPSRLIDYPDFLTRLRRQRSKLSTFAIGDWSPLVNKIIGKPHVKAYLPREGDSMAGTRLLTAWAAEAVRAHNPDVGFVHFVLPDYVGHRYGGKSLQYTHAVARVDRAIGVILANLRLRLTYLEEDWLILVATDHGHLDEGGHGGSQPAVRDIWTIASGGYVPRAALGAGKARQVDLVPTAFKHLGVPVKKAWRLDGRPIPA